MRLVLQPPDPGFSEPVARLDHCRARGTPICCAAAVLPTSPATASSILARPTYPADFIEDRVHDSSVSRSSSERFGLGEDPTDGEGGVRCRESGAQRDDIEHLAEAEEPGGRTHPSSSRLSTPLECSLLRSSNSRGPPCPSGQSRPRRGVAGWDRLDSSPCRHRLSSRAWIRARRQSGSRSCFSR